MDNKGGCKLNRKIENRYLFIALMVGAFLLFFIAQMLFGKTYDEFIYDLEEYQRFGDSIFQTGDFSFLHMQTDFRGWLYPFIMGITHKVLGGIISLRIVLSLLYSLSFVYLSFSFSGMMYKNLNTKHVVVLLTGFLVTTFVFFRGLIFYPLTDLPAACCCVLGACFINSSLNANKRMLKLVYSLCAGGFGYAAYNIRSIYLFSLVLFFLLLICREIRFKHILDMLGEGFMYLAGTVIVAVPQIFINYKWYEKFSVFINNRNLYANQLFWGLQYTRYETYIGEQDIAKTTAGLRYMNDVGTKLLDYYYRNGYREQMVTDYLELAVTFPLDFLKIVIEHVITILTPLYPEVFISNLHQNKVLLVVLSTFLFFWACLVVLYLINKKCFWVQIWCLSLLIPAVVIVLGALETRFGLLLNIIISMLTFGTILLNDFKNWIQNRNKIILGIAFFSIMFISLWVNNRILGQLSGMPISIWG